MKIKQTLTQAYSQLKVLKFTNPDLEADLLLAKVLAKSRAWLLAHPDYELTASELKSFKLLLKKRLAFVPVAYLLGEQEFFGLNFKVNQNTLVPRPETELMVESIIEAVQPKKATTIIDVGTGSGAIIISLAKNLKNAIKFYAVDISLKALVTAKNNAKRHGVEIIFKKSDLLEFVIKNNKLLNKTDELIIAANLPYVPNDYLNNLTQSYNRSLKYEPKLALAGGKDGLDYYRKLNEQIKIIKKAKPGLVIKIYMEIQPGQVTGMRKIFGNDIIIKQDLAGKNRLVIKK